MTIETTTPTETGGGLQETARGLADEVGQTAETRAATMMSQSSDTVREVGRVIRDAAAELGQQQPQLARFGEAAADRVDDAAQYLASHEPRDVIDAAQRYAQERPAIVIGAGLLAGLVLGRVLRSASNGNGSSDWQRSRSGYDRTASRGYGLTGVMDDTSSRSGSTGTFDPGMDIER